MPYILKRLMIWATANGYLVLQQVFYLAVRWQIFKPGVHIQFVWSRWLQRHAAHFLSHSWCKKQIKGLHVISLACACRSGLVMCPRMCRYYLSSPALCALLAPLHSRCLLFCFQVTSLQARLDFALLRGQTLHSSPCFAAREDISSLAWKFPTPPTTPITWKWWRMEEELTRWLDVCTCSWTSRAQKRVNPQLH